MERESKPVCETRCDITPDMVIFYERARPAFDFRTNSNCSIVGITPFIEEENTFLYVVIPEAYGYIDYRDPQDLGNFTVDAE